MSSQRKEKKCSTEGARTPTHRNNIWMNPLKINNSRFLKCFNSPWKTGMHFPLCFVGKVLEQPDAWEAESSQIMKGCCAVKWDIWARGGEEACDAQMGIPLNVADGGGGAWMKGLFEVKRADACETRRMLQKHRPAPRLKPYYAIIDKVTKTNPGSDFFSESAPKSVGFFIGSSPTTADSTNQYGPQ